jgi:hypothetical protein
VLYDDRGTSGKKMVLADHHFIVKVQGHAPELKLQFLGPDYFEVHPKALRGSIERHLLDPSAITITAPTEELREFLREHAKYERIWDEPSGTFRHRDPSGMCGRSSGHVPGPRGTRVPGRARFASAALPLTIVSRLEPIVGNCHLQDDVSS